MKKLVRNGLGLWGALCVVACSSSPIEPPAGAGGTGGASGGGASGGGTLFVNSCSAARAETLGAIDSVSAGAVTILSTAAGVVTLYVNATAGGMNNASANPWTFVALNSGSKVEVTDVTSTESTAWDLALKRAMIYTNGGDGGPGMGGAVLLDKAFAEVTSADAASATFLSEVFFDAECRPTIDQTGAISTSFFDWYTYDEATHVLTPGSGTFLVRGGTGQLYKLAIESYYATPTGGMGTASGAYLLKFEAL